MWAHFHTTTSHATRPFRTSQLDYPRMQLIGMNAARECAPEEDATPGVTKRGRAPEACAEASSRAATDTVTANSGPHEAAMPWRHAIKCEWIHRIMQLAGQA